MECQKRCKQGPELCMPAKCSLTSESSMNVRVGIIVALITTSIP